MTLAVAEPPVDLQPQQRRDLALADPGVLGWTADELRQARRLCRDAAADSARWTLGDWLAAKVPVGVVRGRKNATKVRLLALAEYVGWSYSHLRNVRATATSWPPQTRVHAAGFHVHTNFQDGGAALAAWRREQLLSMQRGPSGRITEAAVRTWRAEHGDAHRGPEYRSRTQAHARTAKSPSPQPAPPTPPPAPAERVATRSTRQAKAALKRCPELAELVHRAEAIVEQLDRWLRRNDPPDDLLQVALVHMDGLIGVGYAIAAAQGGNGR